MRWAGGKRWLARQLAPLLLSRMQSSCTYLEPFLGSGAMFFAIQPLKAILSDLNEDLITTYKQVASSPEIITNHLRSIPSTRMDYEEIRRCQPKSQIEKAIRFIYLNRNCFGGLYRENKAGYFNVPYGGGDRNHYKMCVDSLISKAAVLLNQSDVELNVCDFEHTIKRAKDGDIIYCDPTYREVTRRQFDRYGRIIFNWDDQARLAELALDASRRGAIVIVSNTTCNGIRDLYNHAGVIKIRRPKGLAPSFCNQDLVEYIFVLDPLQDWNAWEKLGDIQLPKHSSFHLAYSRHKERMNENVVLR